MRLFLAALTVGAAGIAYVHTQQASVPAAETHAQVGRPLFDWQSADDTLKAAATDGARPLEEPPLVVRDTINHARAEVTSVLDEFVRVNGASNTVPAPADIAPQSPTDALSSTSENAASDAVADANDSEELIPFASSDSPSTGETAETSPADATVATNQPPTDLVPTKEPEPASEIAATKSEAAPPSNGASGPTLGKPSISEATMLTKKPTSVADPNRSTREPALTVKQPAASGPRTKTELLPGSKAPPKAPLVDPEWKLIGRTSRGVPMHSRRYGRQGTRTLIIAGLDGLDVVATRWNDELSEALLRRTDLLQNNEILIVRAGNPEGLSSRIATNMNGVMINRNFPSRRYQLMPDRSTGTGPGSESETKAIMDVLYSFRPRRVIHLASTSGRSTVLYNRAARDLSDELESQFKLHVQPLDVEQVPGSLEDFADGTLDAAVVSLKLNTSTDWQAAWKKNAGTVITAINGQNPEKLVAVSTEQSALSLEPTGSPIPNIEEEPAPEPKRRRGYEELPPPPR